MEDLRYTLERNDYDTKHRGITVAKTYVQLGANARKIAPPLNIFLGSRVPDLSNPMEAIAQVQEQLPAEQRDRVLAIAFLRETHVKPQVRLGRIGAIAIDALNRTKIPVVSPVGGQINRDGIATVHQRYAESYPHTSRQLPASADIHNVIVLPVFNTPRLRHPVTDALEVAPHIYVGLHGEDMEVVFSKSDLK